MEKLNQNLKIAIDFVEKIKKSKTIKNILQIILFGSVARGEDKADSDIDIAIIHNTDKFKLMESINKFVDEKIQVSYLNIKDLPEEIELISALAGEGILLYGQPLNIKLGKNDLKSKLLISYDLSKLAKPEQMKVNRALHGGISINKYKGKVYKTEVRGLISEEGIEKFSRSVLLIDKRKSAKVIGLFKRFNVRWKEVDVWIG